MDDIYEATSKLGQIGNALDGINGRGGLVKLNECLESISESLSTISETLKSIDSYGVSVTVVNDKTRIPIDVDFPSEVHINLDHNSNPIRVRHYPEAL